MESPTIHLLFSIQSNPIKERERRTTLLHCMVFLTVPPSLPPSLMVIRISNTLIGTLNFITLLISVFLIVSTTSLYNTHNTITDHFRFLQWPILIVSIFVAVLSVLGLFGSCCRVSTFLWVYLVFTILLSLALFCFIVFAFIVTNRGVGRTISGWGFAEHRLGDYSLWLQKRVRDGQTWSEIVAGLRQAEVCTALLDHDTTTVPFSPAEYYKENMSPIQSGCCKPPSYCGYTHMKGTNWRVPESGLVSEEMDCKAWNNDQDKLCYGCNSCKAGVLQNIKDEWRRVSIYLFLLLVFINIVYAVGCCALNNNRFDKYRRM